MRKPSCFFLFVLVGLCCFTAQAQGGFSKFYYLPGSLNSTAADAMETPDHKYLVAGRTDTIINGFIISRLTLMATNLQGHTLWTRSYGDQDLDYPDIFQRNQFYCAEKNHAYICCTGRDDAGNIFATLTRINYQGDTIWQKRYSDPAANMVPQVLIKAVDGGLYMCGYYSIKTGGRPVFLLRLSENGDLLWKKIINKSAPNVMSAADMLQDTASRKLIITGYQYLGSGTYSSVLFLDSLGNTLSHKSYNNACGGAAGQIIQLVDGNFLTSARMSINCDHGIYHARLIKIDIDGKLLWEKLMYPYGPLNSTHPHGVRPNGDIVAMGVIDSSYFTRFKYLLLDPNGNIKRQATYGRLNDIFVSDLGRGGSFTSDGGYITAMQLTGEPSPTPFYIIKLDSMGCDTVPEYCEWERTVGLKEQQQSLQAQIYPNPCNEVLWLAVAGDKLPAKVRIYDQSGRLLREEESLSAKHSLSTAGLSPGYYFIEVLSETGIYRASFIVQH